MSLSVENAAIVAAFTKLVEARQELQDLGAESLLEEFKTKEKIIPLFGKPLSKEQDPLPTNKSNHRENHEYQQALLDRDEMDEFMTQKGKEGWFVYQILPAKSIGYQFNVFFKRPV